MAKCYEPAYAEFEREADAIRRGLATADTLGLRSDPVARDQGAQIKAFAYVWTAAALEGFLRSALQSLARDLTARNVRACDTRPCLQSLSHFAIFDSLRDLRGMRRWRRRVELLGDIASPSPAVFCDSQLPIDHRTPRLEHFRTIWAVYGFPGDPLPSPNHALALHELAEGRNDIAHGHLPALQFGRRKVVSDVARIVQCVEEVVFHTASAIDEYLSMGLFAR